MDPFLYSLLSRGCSRFSDLTCSVCMAIALMVDFAIDKFFDSSIHLVKYT